MMLWVVFGLGALYGLAMRLLFGMPMFDHSGMAGSAGPMMASFVVLVPVLMGVFTVHAVRKRPPSLLFAVFGPWIPTTCFAAGSGVVLIEGSICIAMALPIFWIMSSAGGVLCWIVLKFVDVPRGSVNGLLLLPLLLAWPESQEPLPRTLARSEAAIHIAAPAEVVWGLINHATAIAPAEMSGGLAYRIGLPYPVEAVTQATAHGRVRKLRWAGGVAFDEPITAWQENRLIAWTYAFGPDSFPPGTLDEHVLIGGKYFDLVDTAYRLVPEAGGTRLEIVVDYRVSTGFNWYAVPAGRLLVDDAAQTILRFYKRRSEAAAHAA
jgi:hypothetical protein